MVGRKDISGLVLRNKLGGRYLAGREYEIAGRVKNSAGHTAMTIEISDRVFSGEISANNDFSINFRLEPEDKGPQWMTIWLGDREKLLGRIAPVYVE
jgi:hypothetical protein